jgi:asparagine synthase (glutamine-hydrolysing)
MLGRPLVELAMALPGDLKIRRGTLKTVLREAMRGVVPEPILERRDKIGFAAPTAAWMRGGLTDWWREALTSQSFRERGCFRLKGVVELIRRFDAGDDAAARPLWRMAIVEQWARRFLDRPASDREQRG